MTSKLHPFEESGCGVGPFAYVGFVAMPSRSLAEANPDAYNNALRALPTLHGGCGTCHHCGMAISNICIIKDSTGKIFGVGTTCVEKTGDPCLANPAEIALARHNSAQRRAKKAEANRKRVEEYLARPEVIAARKAEELAREGRRIAVLAKWRFMLTYLDGRGGFCDSVARGIENGEEPRGRAVEILRDIYAKAHGRRGSAAYDAAADTFDLSLEVS